MRHLFLTLCALAFPSCALNDTAKLKASKTCVIATSITDEADFHSLGFTTFGNKHVRSRVPGLKSMTEQILREELGRFYQVKAVVVTPDLGDHSISKRKSVYDAAMADSRARHNADLEIHVYSYGFHPYGIPSHLEAEGFGFYSGGASGSGTAVSYNGMTILDGDTGAQVASPTSENDYGFIPDADTFAKERYERPGTGRLRLEGTLSGTGWDSMTPAQQAQLMKTFRELYRAKVRNDLWRMELR
jgi:hypothetical protein